MDAKERAHLRALCEDVALPLRAECTLSGHELVDANDEYIGDIETGHSDDDEWCDEVHADLIVGAVNALPALLAEVRALRAERERTEAALREIASLGESIVKCREYLQSTDHHDNYMDRNRCRTEEAKAVDRLILASIAYWREPKETNNAT